MLRANRQYRSYQLVGGSSDPSDGLLIRMSNDSSNSITVPQDVDVTVVGIPQVMAQGLH